MTQLICIRPEKNIRTCSFFEPIPQLAATILLRSTIPTIYVLFVSNRNIGVIFCHVRKIRLNHLDSFSIKDTPQKCNGASLVLSSNPRLIHLPIMAARSETTPPPRMAIEPTLWTMK